jgi:hypothetical protein
VRRIDSHYRYELIGRSGSSFGLVCYLAGIAIAAFAEPRLRDTTETNNYVISQSRGIIRSVVIRRPTDYRISYHTVWYGTSSTLAYSFGITSGNTSFQEWSQVASFSFCDVLINTLEIQNFRGTMLIGQSHIKTQCISRIYVAWSTPIKSTDVVVRGT